MTKLATLVFALAAALAAQVPKIPVFHAASRLVVVNVIVQGKHGAAVTDLTRNDFAIKDRGMARSISVFSLDASTTGASAIASSQRLPADTFTNLPHYGATPPRSVTIVLLDNLNTLYGSTPEPNNSVPEWDEDLALANGRNHLVKFLQTLQPQDRIAIYGLRHRLHVLCDFTCSRSQLLALVQGYDTSSVTSRSKVEPDAMEDNVLPAFNRPSNFARLMMARGANQNRTTETLAALRSIAAHVSNIPGRKNLVWLTSDLTISPKAMARILTPADIAVYPIDARGFLAGREPISVLSGSEGEDTVSGAAGYRMPSAVPVPPGIPQMDELAARTGGHAFVNTNDLTGAVRTAVEDSQVTYTLGFYVDASDLDGKFHQLKIKVDRGGLSIRYPRAYLAYKSQPATMSRNQLQLLTALRSPLSSNSIPVLARIALTNQPSPGTLRITGDVDLHNLQLTQNGPVRTGAIAIFVFLQNAAGKVLQRAGSTVHIRLTAARYKAELASGLLFQQTVQPAAGATLLRLVVQDPATSLMGSIIIPLASVK
ncbi:MAG: VWA domain-containing protein [Terriglobales bacterium]